MYTRNLVINSEANRAANWRMTWIKIEFRTNDSERGSPLKIIAIIVRSIECDAVRFAWCFFVAAAAVSFVQNCHWRWMSGHWSWLNNSLARALVIDDTKNFDEEKLNEHEFALVIAQYAASWLRFFWTTLTNNVKMLSASHSHRNFVLLVCGWAMMRSQRALILVQKAMALWSNHTHTEDIFFSCSY